MCFCQFDGWFVYWYYLIFDNNNFIEWLNLMSISIVFVLDFKNNYIVVFEIYCGIDLDIYEVCCE